MVGDHMGTPGVVSFFALFLLLSKNADKFSGRQISKKPLENQSKMGQKRKMSEKSWICC
jgi:hypothetical protein